MAKDSKLYKKQETERLKNYVSEHNLWVSDIVDTQNYFNEGAEQKVYLIDGRNVIKTNDSIFYNSWEDYLNSLLLHNYFFPANAYELIGFWEHNEVLYAVVKQAFVKATEETDLEFVKAFMAENGFVNTKNNDYFNPELGLILEDLHDENVLTKDGILHFVDTVFYIDDIRIEFKNEQEMYDKFIEIKNIIDFDDEKINVGNNDTSPYRTVRGLHSQFTRTEMHEFLKEGKVVKRIVMSSQVGYPENKYILDVMGVIEKMDDGGNIDTKTIEHYKIDDLIIKSYKDVCGDEPVTKYSLETRDGLYKSYADCSAYSYWGNTDLTPDDKKVYPHRGYNYMFVTKDINIERKQEYVKLLNELISDTNYKGYKDGGDVSVTRENIKELSDIVKQKKLLRLNKELEKAQYNGDVQKIDETQKEITETNS